jgi:sorbitol/mannitol transport system permease protein
MVPAVALIVPLYFFYDKIHLLNNRIGLALVYTATGLPLVIWMLSAYLTQVPGEVLQAARVDGAGIARMLRSVLAPMMAPGLVAVAVLTFLANWSEFMLAVTLTSSRNAATVPVSLVQLDEVYGVQWQYLSAAVIVAIFIPVIVGAVLQRRIVAGITAGAVK